MRINNLYLIISGLLLSVSSPVVAHTGGPGTGILDLLIHPLAADTQALV